MSRSHFGTLGNLSGLDDRQNHADGEEMPQSEPFDAELYVLNYFPGGKNDTTVWTRGEDDRLQAVEYDGPLIYHNARKCYLARDERLWKVWLSKDNHLGIQTYMRHNNDVSTLEQAAELKEYLHMAQDSVIATSAQRTLSRQQVRQLRDNNSHSSLRKSFEKFDLEDDVEAHLSIMSHMLPYVEEETKHLTEFKETLEASKRRGKLDDMKMERTVKSVLSCINNLERHINWILGRRDLIIGAGISPLRSVLLDVSGFSVASLPNVGDEEEFNEFEDDRMVDEEAGENLEDFQSAHEDDMDDVEVKPSPRKRIRRIIEDDENEESSGARPFDRQSTVRNGWHCFSSADERHDDLR
ncbi:hypothetical protein E4T43_01996 [Aureobasidium subglaciale]|nr:hypothetical protein E4T43_01996 [Aureobasidium subglaciale]